MTLDENVGDDDGTVHYYYELPLLAVALLHHVKLGQHSSIAPYVQMLQTSPVGFHASHVEQHTIALRR